MRRFFIAVFSLLSFILLQSSCLSPDDPSNYNDEESLLHDSSKIHQFVKKELPAEEQSHITDDEQAEFEAHVFAVEDAHGGFGYNIIRAGKLYIHQGTIPAISGTKTFSSQMKAMHAAEFVIHKLKIGIEPPSVTKEELDSLGVLD